MPAHRYRVVVEGELGPRFANAFTRRSRVGRLVLGPPASRCGCLLGRFRYGCRRHHVQLERVTGPDGVKLDLYMRQLWVAKARRSSRHEPESWPCTSRSAAGPLPAPMRARVTAWRSTPRRGSLIIRSRSVRCFAGTASQTKSSPPGWYTTCSRRPRPRAPSSNAGSEPKSRGSSIGLRRFVARRLHVPANASCDTASRTLARAVFAADKIAKVRELALVPALQLNEPKNRAKLAHYRESLEMLRRAAGELALVDLLDAEFERLTPTVTTRRRVRARKTSRTNERVSISPSPREAQPLSTPRARCHSSSARARVDKATACVV